VTTDQNERLARAVPLLERRLHPAAIVLFGSQATGHARPDSDVDLGVLLGGAAPDPFSMAGLKTDLEDLVGRPVDLVVLDSASPILAMEVLRSHRMLAQRDPELFEAFTVRSVLAYLDLKRVRAPIERALLGKAGGG
jgi:predicted nucleotidyltransferase